jgi:hypothetical protein
MHGPINVKAPNNTSKWQMGFNSAFKGLTSHIQIFEVTNFGFVNKTLSDFLLYQVRVKIAYGIGDLIHIRYW